MARAKGASLAICSVSRFRHLIATAFTIQLWQSSCVLLASSCSVPGPFNISASRDISADLLVSGTYVEETVVSFLHEPKLGILQKTVNSMFELSDLYVSSVPINGCLQANITIKVTVVDGCVNILNLWKAGSRYIVALQRSMDGHYEFYNGEPYTGKQSPFSISTPATELSVRSTVCQSDQACLTRPASLCHPVIISPANFSDQSHIGVGGPQVVVPPDVPEPVDPPSNDSNEVDGGDLSTDPESASIGNTTVTTLSGYSSSNSLPASAGSTTLIANYLTASTASRAAMPASTGSAPTGNEPSAKAQASIFSSAVKGSAASNLLVAVMKLAFTVRFFATAVTYACA